MKKRISSCDLITAREAADVLAVSVWSIYSLAKRGTLRSYVIGETRTIRFRRNDVARLLRESTGDCKSVTAADSADAFSKEA